MTFNNLLKCSSSLFTIPTLHCFRSKGLASEIIIKKSFDAHFRSDMIRPHHLCEKYQNRHKPPGPVKHQSLGVETSRNNRSRRRFYHIMENISVPYRIPVSCCSCQGSLFSPMDGLDGSDQSHAISTAFLQDRFFTIYVVVVFPFER